MFIVFTIFPSGIRCTADNFPLSTACDLYEIGHYSMVSFLDQTPVFYHVEGENTVCYVQRNNLKRMAPLNTLNKCCPRSALTKPFLNWLAMVYL
ncbi:hypothetical protein HMPREF1705_04762 [Acetomicrobium hydrogeniformans ATCC BAA-1850]|uniref:Uncharacterized protein n=1 Tax=Acetomicrobium hydrogeniformans ATCC BAA-1850 TaxID=592015 RepID=A0A0T5X7T8_9BACT|nr:hypothetical protein HMPREF1705_04762 [Acetomicrobium hydrogeniformans ATCC BAA-1850]